MDSPEQLFGATKSASALERHLERHERLSERSLGDMRCRRLEFFGCNDGQQSSNQGMEGTMMTGRRISDSLFLPEVLFRVLCQACQPDRWKESSHKPVEKRTPKTSEQKVMQLLAARTSRLALAGGQARAQVRAVRPLRPYVWTRCS